MTTQPNKPDPAMSQYASKADYDAAVAQRAQDVAFNEWFGESMLPKTPANLALGYWAQEAFKAGAQWQASRAVALQDIEQYRMQMAAISTAALGYWKAADSIHADYDTVPLRDVAALYAKYAALHEANEQAQQAAPSDLHAAILALPLPIPHTAGDGNHLDMFSEMQFREFRKSVAELAANVAPANDMRDAYVGAREDLQDWKRRALKAEELNRKFMTDINGPTFMGEPVIATHADDIAVDRFAVAMKEKMAVSRAKGRNGWNNEAECTMDSLALMLVQHIAKGDPVDIGNFAMMLHQREAMAVEHHPCNGGEAAKALRRLAPAQNAVGVPDDIAQKLTRQLLWIAFVWNDHNFAGTASSQALDACRAVGINSLVDANKYLAAHQQEPKP